MNFIFHGEIIDYDYKFSNFKSTILFLHGWGGDKNSFKTTQNLLSSYFNILSLTLPTTKKTSTSWTLFDYVDCVKCILKNLGIGKISIICHSFGFRVATLLKNEIEIEKLVVTGGAGPKRQNVFKKIHSYNNQILLSKKKYNFLYDKIASEDYKNLSLINKQTFKNIVNFNTSNMLSFNCHILLFWGKKDKETPLWIAKKIKKQNKTKLIKTNSNHFAYLKENVLFNHEILRFL